MECKLQCPACGSPLTAELLDEITMVACVCGEIFAVQHPDVEWDKPKKRKSQAKAKVKAKLPPLSLELLEAADDRTSAAVIAAFTKHSEFKAFAKMEMEAIMARDAEDDEKVNHSARTRMRTGGCLPDHFPQARATHPAPCPQC